MEHEKKKIKNSKLHFITLGLGTVFTTYIVVLLIIYIPYGMISKGIYNELNNLKLIPEPERYTELYFNSTSSLPTQTFAGVSDSFSFTVHNVEGTTTTYPYRVYFEYPLGTQVTLASGSVSLADNASTSIPVSHTFLASNEKGMVVVALTSLNQSIDFLVPDDN